MPASLIARLCHLAVLGALWFLFLRDRRRWSAVLALGIAAVFPGFIYQDAIFPISMTALAIIVSLWLLSRGHPLAGGLVGAVAALSYSTGVFLAVAGAAAILVLPSLRGWPSRARAAVLYCTPIAAAGSLLLLVWELSTGRWDAYFLTQEHYHYEYVFFLTELWHRVYALTEQSVVPDVALFQSGVVALMVAMCLIAVLLRWRDRDDRDVVLCAFALVFWAFPLSLGGGNLSLYRAEALLVPMTGLLVRLPVRVNVALLILFVPIGVEMASLFFEGTLH